MGYIPSPHSFNMTAFNMTVPADETEPPMHTTEIPAGTIPAAAYYRREARRLAELAAASPFGDTKVEFLELAQQFTTLAQHIEFVTRSGA
jgi:hypothetical protein